MVATAAAPPSTKPSLRANQPKSSIVAMMRGSSNGTPPLHPAVIDLGRLVAQQQILDPVGRRPAGRPARAEADAPGRLALGGDRLGQRVQILEGFGHRVAGILEVFRHIPDQRFHIGLVGKGVKRRHSVRARDSCPGQPSFRRRHNWPVSQARVASPSGARSPLAARSAIRPGCGRIAISGGEPASVSMTICCS